MTDKKSINEKAARMAEALRANLKRRKAATRKVREADKGQEPERE
jgi:hypothetical protein